MTHSARGASSTRVPSMASKTPDYGPSPSLAQNSDSPPQLLYKTLPAIEDVPASTKHLARSTSSAPAQPIAAPPSGPPPTVDPTQVQHPPPTGAPRPHTTSFIGRLSPAYPIHSATYAFQQLRRPQDSCHQCPTTQEIPPQHPPSIYGLAPTSSLVR